MAPLSFEPRGSNPTRSSSGGCCPASLKSTSCLSTRGDDELGCSEGVARAVVVRVAAATAE
eukprot:7269407-Prymnesium_polylepis.1